MPFPSDLSGPISTSAGSPGLKDAEQAFQPLLLATITFVDGTILRLSTHALNALEGGFQYQGNDYEARLLDQNIDAVQAMSDTGIDIPPTMTLQIADADRFIWTYFEMAIGFKGATLDLDLVLWQAGTHNYSSDSYRKFSGICDPALVDEKTVTVSASSKLNMQKILFPIIPVQARCPWIFPAVDASGSNIASQKEALNNPDSPFFPCGYSGDIGGKGNPGFTDCQYTRQACIDRGMFTKDAAGHQTGHFGGVEWDPPLWWKGIQYVTGNTTSGINASTQERFNDYVPMVYGTVFVDGIVLNIIGSANTTNMEVLLCFGDIGNGDSGSSGGVQLVVVNGVLIPYNYNATGGPRPADPNFIWAYVNYGARDSMANPGPNYNGLGDPYGNLAVIKLTVPVELTASSAVPPVQIACIGPACRVWYNVDPANGSMVDATVSLTQPGLFYRNAPGGAMDILGQTSYLFLPAVNTPGQGNPIWILMDLLVRANWTYSQLNIQSFINAALKCQVQIPYTNNAGVVTMYNNPTINEPNSTPPHIRFSCSLAVTKRRTAADVIQGVRNCCRAMLVPNDRDGLLQVFIKQGLGDQQPAAIDGSNQNMPVQSLMADSSIGQGFSAYDFDESSILEDSNGASTLKITQRRVHDSPNSISTTFQDQDNQYVTDSMTELDPVDVARASQTVVGGSAADGLNSYDQSQRVFESTFAETFRGNPRQDSGGTLVFSFQTTQKVAHLQVGQICRFSHQQLNLSFQMVRLIAIQPSRDYETAKVTLQWHEDRWYEDTYGQQGQPIYAGNNKNHLNRPPFAWQPYTTAPFAGDSICDPTDYTFALRILYSTALDGSAIVKLAIAGVAPVNVFSTLQAPLIALQGEVFSGNTGYLNSGQLLYAVICPYAPPPTLASDSSLAPIATVGPPARAPIGGGALQSLAVSGPPILLAPPQIIPCTIAIPDGGTDSNSFIIKVPVWPPGAVGWYLFAGPNHLQMTYQATGTGTPGEITFSGNPPIGVGAGMPSSSLNVREVAPPDVNFDHVTVRVKLQLHGGVWGDQVDVIGSATPAVAAGANDVVTVTYYTDLVIGPSVIQISSASEPFTAANIGDTLIILGGAVNLPGIPGFNLGAYQIVDVQSGIAQVSAFIGEIGLIGGFGTITHVVPSAAVPSTGPTLQFLGATWPVNQWAGYDVSFTANQTNYLALGLAQPILNFRVASNTADTLTLENLAPDVVTTFDLVASYGIAVGDVAVMRAKPDTFTALTLGDSNFINLTTPSQPTTTMGLTPDEGNSVLRIFAGTGKGQWRNVVSNTATVYTVDSPFNPIPDATSRFWIEETAWQPGGDSSSVQNSSLFPRALQVAPRLAPEVVVPGSKIGRQGATRGGVAGDSSGAGALSITAPVSNYNGESIVIQALTYDSLKNPCLEQYAPIRDFYIFGQPGFGTPKASFIFGRGTNGGPADIHVADNTNLVVVKTGGTLYGWDGIVETTPADTAIIVDILLFNAANLKGISIFPAGTKLAPNPQMTIPARAFTLQSGTAFNGAVTVVPGDRLKGVVLSVGSSVPGQSGTFNLYWR